MHHNPSKVCELYKCSAKYQVFDHDRGWIDELLRTKVQCSVLHDNEYTLKPWKVTPSLSFLSLKSAALRLATCPMHEEAGDSPKTDEKIMNPVTVGMFTFGASSSMPSQQARVRFSR